jgi:sugar phosphate isomerase/epimerase
MRGSNGFGYRLRDREDPWTEAVLADAERYGRPVEVGLYHGHRDDPGDRLAERLRSGAVPVSTHLDHRIFNVFWTHLRFPALREQAARSRALGASLAVTHVGAEPMTPRLARGTELLDRLLTNLRTANSIFGGEGLRLHVENVFHGVAFYRRLMRAVRDARLDAIGFCFDLGHAKVWSQDSLADWLALLEDLSADGCRLHFHLHANGGLTDEHLAFPEAQRLGLLEPGDYVGAASYVERVDELVGRFPGARFIFEVSPEEALENLRFVSTGCAAVLANRLRPAPTCGTRA